jgi:hypothetical protein
MAAPKKRKPIPKSQSQLTREQFEAYDEVRGTPPPSEKKNRARQISVKNDTVKLPTVTFKDIDTALFYYFKNVIKPTVSQNGVQIDVPVIYGNPERWAAVQRDGFLRDGNGKVQVPLIMFKKQTIEKNRSLGNKLDGNEVNNFLIYQKKFSKRNIYDRFSILANREPSQELYGVVIPDYVTVTYQCVMFTDYVEQADKLIEALNFASDAYWGDKESYRFRANIDSFTPNIEMAQGQDRGVKTTFSIRLHGYIISDAYNRDLANMKKFYSKSQLNFKMETAGTAEELTARSATPASEQPVRFFDQSAPGPSGDYRLRPEELTYLTLKNAAIADSKTGTSATLSNRTIATPPAGYNAVTVQDFEVYINGRRVPASQVTSVTQVGTDILVVIDVPGFFEEAGAVLESTDEVLVVGKFS